MKGINLLFFLELYKATPVSSSSAPASYIASSACEKRRDERQQQVSGLLEWAERAFPSLSASLTGGGVIFMNAFLPLQHTKTDV